jgi:polyisoprenoid-binding protein YceI
MKLLIAFLSFSYTSLFSAPIVYHVDNTHSSIQFTIPFFGVTEVSGRFDRFCGQFNYDESNLAASQIELYIDASSINTALEIRDRDLVKDYFEIDKYPLIVFISKSIESKKAKQFEVMGDLAMHGITKSISFSLRVIGEISNTDGTKELGLKMSPLMLSRMDYKIMTTVGQGMTVGDSVTTTALIRLRDISKFRHDFDTKHPNQSAANTFQFDGKFINRSKKIKIKLISSNGNYFVSFNDGEWQWFNQAKPIGINHFKLMSFNHMIELKSNSFIYLRDNNIGPEVFSRVSGQ